VNRHIRIFAHLAQTSTRTSALKHKQTSINTAT